MSAVHPSHEFVSICGKQNVDCVTLSISFEMCSVSSNKRHMISHSLVDRVTNRCRIEQ